MKPSPIHPLYHLTFLTLSLLLLPLTSFAHDFEAINNGKTIYYNKISDTKCAVTYYGTNATSAKYSGDIIIPATVTYGGTTLSVTSIDFEAFSGCSSLTSISIPEGVTEIWDDAFCGCSSLTSISLPSSLTFIGTWAFSFCTSLTSISLPEGLTSIDWWAFGGCTSLTSISIPESVTNIGWWVFEACSSLSSVTNLATTPQDISSAAFNEVPLSEATLYVPAGSLEAYQNAEGWQDFGTISPIVNIIASGPCGANGDNLTYTLTEDGLLTISGTGAMAKWDYYNHSPFESDERITSVVLSEGVTSIGDRAFRYCSSLNSISLPESLTAIGGWTLQNCTALTSIYLPSALTTIGSWAFDACTSLTSISLPTSLTTIGSFAFSGCSSLTSITVDPTNLDLSSLDGVLFNKDQSTLICCPAAKQGSYNVPIGVTSIDHNAFSDCTALTSISLPNTLTYIGGWAFYKCTSITSISIPESVTSIAYNAFIICM